MRLKIAVSVVRFRPWAPVQSSDTSGFSRRPNKGQRYAGRRSGLVFRRRDHGAITSGMTVPAVRHRVGFTKRHHRRELGACIATSVQCASAAGGIMQGFGTILCDYEGAHNKT
jgi:hypothetical protein